MTIGSSVLRVSAVFTLCWQIAQPQQAAAQAIDCAMAANSVQKSICADADLKALDAKMVSLYSDAIRNATPAGVKQIATEHQRWVAIRDACSKEKDVKTCVTEALTAGGTICLPSMHQMLRDRPGRGQ